LAGTIGDPFFPNSLHKGAGFINQPKRIRMHFAHDDAGSSASLFHLGRGEFGSFHGIAEPFAHRTSKGHACSLSEPLEGRMHLRRDGDREPDVLGGGG
jgi:hypothetical protein